MPDIATYRFLPAVSITAGFFLLPCLAPAATPADTAADLDQPIDQIVVVAHKNPRSIREIAANVTSMSRADLKADLATSVGDALRYLPGIDIEAAGNRFGTEGINIRGIGGNRVAIVVDGVPLSDHFDVGSFSNATRDFIDAGLVQSIEVLHGPASALYGSAAIGGVIAVNTPEPFDLVGSRGRGGELLVTWRGSDDSLQTQAMLAGGDRSLGFMAGASYRESEQLDSAGTSNAADVRDARRMTVLSKLVGDNRLGHTWRASLLHQQSDTRSDLNSMLGTGRYRSTTALEGDDRYRLDMLLASYEFGADGGLVDDGIVRAFFEVADIRQDTLDERGNARTPVSNARRFVFEQEIAGVDLNLWKTLTTTRLEHRFGAGIEFRQRRTEEYRDGQQTNLETGAVTSVLLGEAFPLRDFPISTTEDFGAYLEDSMSIGNWTVIAALRADRYKLSPHNDPMYFEDYPFAEPIALSETDVSPKLGVILAVSPAMDLYLQYAHGFRAPPYADANIGLDIPFFNYRAIPNPDLKSESSRGIDAGLRWASDSLDVRLSLFHTRYEDFIESKLRLGEDPVSGRILFQSQNLRETRIEGAEASWTWRPGGRFSAIEVDGSAYFARGRNVESGAALNSVGPAEAVLGMTWRSADERRQVRIKATLTDAWDDRDESAGELFKPGGHAVLDAYLTQRVGSRATLRIGAMNLTDRKYWRWSDVRGLEPDDPILPYLAQAGRHLSVSLNASW